MAANNHPNAHPAAGAYSNAAQIAADLTAVGVAAAVRSVSIVRHHAMLLQTRIMAGASGRPGPRAETGDYRRSWSTEITSPGAGVTMATVGTNKPQARRLEYGFVGADRLGRVFNQPPYPHMGPAVDQTEGPFTEALGDLGEWT